MDSENRSETARGDEKLKASDNGDGFQVARKGTEPLIRVEGLRKSFDGVEVLRGASLSVSSGESMVVIGGSGTGKSVLVKHVMGLLRPDEGKVIVKGEVISELSRSRLNELRRITVSYTHLTLPTTPYV